MTVGDVLLRRVQKKTSFGSSEYFKNSFRQNSIKSKTLESQLPPLISNVDSAQMQGLSNVQYSNGKIYTEIASTNMSPLTELLLSRRKQKTDLPCKIIPDTDVSLETLFEPDTRYYVNSSPLPILEMSDLTNF